MIGRLVSHYRILSELGAGGMGVVYRAEDLTLGRQVAIKFLAAQLDADPDARRRFLHEAKAAAALDHSGICAVHEAGEHDGSPYIVMALLAGRTLRERIAEGPLPIPEAVAVALQVAEALHEAHANGVVHRDIKPANIMLTPKGQAKVMDFGLAQLSGVSQLTRTGTTLGTVAYLSPEQARGEAADGRSDLWSLGVVLYEMVSGRRPFAGDREAVLISHLLHGEPPPLTGLRTGVPVALEHIVDKCLAKDAGRRYQHADELAVDLRRLLAELDVTRSLPSARASRARSGPTARIRTAVLVALFAIAAVSVGMWVHQRSGRATSTGESVLAVVDFENLGGAGEAATTAGLDGLLQVGLVERSPIRVVSREYLQDLRRRLFGGQGGPIRADQALAVARKAGSSLLLLGQVGRQGEATFAVWRLVDTTSGRAVGGRRVVAADLVALADGIIAQVVPCVSGRAGVAATKGVGTVADIATSSPEAYRQFAAGETAFTNGRTEDARPLYQAAVAADSTFALAWLRLADLEWSLTRFEPAAGYADRAWRLRARLGVKDRMMLESRRLQLDGNVAAALDVYREMLARWPDDRSILRTYCDAVSWWWLFPEAQQIAEQGLDVYPEDEDLGAVRCSALMARGRDAEARAAVLDYRRRHPGKARGWDLAGEAHLAAGEADSAEACFARARVLEPDEWSLRYDSMRCAAVRGEVARAEAILHELLARPDLSESRRARVLAGYNEDPGLITLCAETGRLRQALTLAESTRRAMPSPDQLAWRGFRHAMLLSGADRPRQALAVLQRLDLASCTPVTRLWGAARRLEVLVQVDSLATARTELVALLAAPDRTASLARYTPLSITAALSLAEGRPDSALAALTRLEDQQRLLAPELETRAAALRALGRLPEAAATLEGLLRRNGIRFIARYELGKVYQEMGRLDDAAREYRVFLEAWSQADPDFPQVPEARRRLAALLGAG